MYETFDLIIFSVIRVTSYASPRLQIEKNKIELISKLCQKHESDLIKRFNGIIYTVHLTHGLQPVVYRPPEVQGGNYRRTFGAL